MSFEIATPLTTDHRAFAHFSVKRTIRLGRSDNRSRPRGANVRDLVHVDPSSLRRAARREERLLRAGGPGLAGSDAEDDEERRARLHLPHGLQEHRREWVVECERDNEEDGEDGEERGGLDDHGRDARILRAMARTKSVGDAPAESEEPQHDGNGDEDVNCQRDREIGNRPVQIRANKWRCGRELKQEEDAYH